MEKIRINERFSVQGTSFDWRLIEHTTNVDTRTKKTVEGERVHFFPRLSFIATHIIDRMAKDATTIEELIQVINDSTQQVVARLEEVDNSYERTQLTSQKKKEAERLKQRKGANNAAKKAAKQKPEQHIVEEQPQSNRGRRRRRKKG